MDVRLTQDQMLLRDSVREFLQQECPIQRIRTIAEGDHDEADALWAGVSELGWPGLTLPAEYGGAGLDLVDLAVVFEEAGAALFPSSLFSTVALGAPCVLLAGSPRQKTDLLPAIAKGSLRLTFAQLEDNNGWGSEHLGQFASPSPDGFLLNGRKHHVLDATTSDLLVVVLRTQPGSEGSEGLSLLLVAADAPGISIRRTGFLDGTHSACEVEFRDVRVPADQLLGAEGDGDAVLRQVLAGARVALCAEMTGGAQRVLDLSVAHAKERKQFGKPIGSFQAVAHKCADMLVRVEGARSATYYAAWALANGLPEADTASCLAKAYCSDAYAQVAGDAIQIHGGLGFTWEEDPHLYFRRAKTSEHLLGDAAWHRELAARALLD